MYVCGEKKLRDKRYIIYPYAQVGRINVTCGTLMIKKKRMKVT